LIKTNKINEAKTIIEEAIQKITSTKTGNSNYSKGLIDDLNTAKTQITQNTSKPSYFLNNNIQMHSAQRNTQSITPQQTPGISQNVSYMTSKKANLQMMSNVMVNQQQMPNNFSPNIQQQQMPSVSNFDIRGVSNIQPQFQLHPQTQVSLQNFQPGPRRNNQQQMSINNFNPNFQNQQTMNIQQLPNQNIQQTQNNNNN